MKESKITPEARERMRHKPRWQQRKEALLECIEEKHRPIPVREDDDADDSAIRRQVLL